MRVALGVPILGMMHGTVAYTHMGLAAEIAKQAELFIPEAEGYTPYSRARNVIFDRAIRHDCDYVFFADADNLMPIGAFGAMLRMLQAEEAQLVTGYAIKRQPPWDTVWTVVDEARAVEADGLPVELAGCGLACALVDLRWIQDHLKEPYFYMDAETNEDYPFCCRIREEGGRILGHTGVISGHMPDLLPITPANAAEYTALWEKHNKNSCMRVHERELTHDIT